MTVCSCRPEPVAAYPFPNQTARVTFPERRHLVHTLMCFGEPLTIAFTRFTLGFQVLLERLCEWDTLMPKETSLPQKSHFAMLQHLLNC
jgi:hypothetical protein